MPSSHPTRRRVLAQLLATAALPPLAYAAHPKPAATAPIPVEVWKDAQCGCCQDWIAHLQQHGFAVTAHDGGNAAMRTQLGLPAALGSCHTARVGGYVVEGHVPAADIHRLLAQRPKALGLAVPGMPIGSPGMDGPAYGGRKDAYDVLLVTRTAPGQPVATRVFSQHR